MTNFKRGSSGTEAIDLSRPVPNGFGRIAFDTGCSAVGLQQPRSLSISDDTNRRHGTWLFSGVDWAAESEKSSFADLLASLSFVSANTMKNVTAAACVQWMNVFGPDQSTRFVNAAAYTEFALRFATVAVSPRLRIARSLLPTSAFLAPSGAQLTWAEVMAEDDHGGEY
jgi:hypothetical protein